jgi:hypothetical protein
MPFPTKTASGSARFMPIFPRIRLVIGRERLLEPIRVPALSIAYASFGPDGANRVLFGAIFCRVGFAARCKAVRTPDVHAQKRGQGHRSRKIAPYVLQTRAAAIVRSIADEILAIVFTRQARVGLRLRGLDSFP